MSFKADSYPRKYHFSIPPLYFITLLDKPNPFTATAIVGSKVYMYGGESRQGKQTYLNDFWVMDLTTARSDDSGRLVEGWAKLEGKGFRAAWPPAVSQSTLTHVNGTLYLIGDSVCVCVLLFLVGSCSGVVGLVGAVLGRGWRAEEGVSLTGRSTSSAIEQGGVAVLGLIVRWANLLLGRGEKKKCPRQGSWLPLTWSVCHRAQQVDVSSGD